MPRELPVIRYSLKDRGRVFGIPRDNINIKGIVGKINGDECQERVAMRDVQGYLGHWPRVRFNMRPTTGGIAEGKVHYIEPALVTTQLKAFPDGTVEHTTEFLDTDSGIIAGKMWDNKVGGFSSAIDLNDNSFFGFDYVPDPNYINNSFRGIALDSASMTDEEIEAAASYELTHAMLLIINQKDYALDQASAALNNLMMENEELLAALSARKDAGAMLDNARFERPFSVALDSAGKMLRDIEAFNNTAQLPRFQEPKKLASTDDAAYNTILSQFRLF